MSYKSKIQTIPGTRKKDVMVFSLSDDTCIWCDKTKDLLNKMGLQYSYINVDSLDKEEQEEAYKDMWKYAPGSTSFPTVVVDSGQFVISGFSESELKALL
ncbi:MAG: glutaredoxin family protein [Candidatus Paceibacterota bacterium]